MSSYSEPSQPPAGIGVTELVSTDECVSIPCPRCGCEYLQETINYTAVTMCGNVETFVRDGTVDLVCKRCRYAWTIRLSKQ